MDIENLIKNIKTKLIKNSYIENQNILISGISNNQIENIKWKIEKKPNVRIKLRRFINGSNRNFKKGGGLFWDSTRYRMDVLQTKNIYSAKQTHK